MLNSLLKKIKQQRSSQASKSINQSPEQIVLEKISQSKEPYETEPIKVSQQIHPQKLSFEVITQPSRIKYCVIDNPPNIWNRILSSPISTWNYLTYGKRYVKEIDLKKHQFPQQLNFLKPLLNHELPTYNHILINRYPQGIGIMSHTDGPLYKDKVIVLSLGGPSIIKFTPLPNFHKTSTSQTIKNSQQILLQDNSIHIFEDEAYTNYMHGIQNYSLDSIFLKVEQGKIINKSILNKVKILDKIQKTIKEDQNIQNISNSIQQDSSFTISKVKENEQYNWKIEIVRKERISITIREKYEQESI